MLKNAFSYSFEALLHLTKTFMGLTSIPLLLVPALSCAGSPPSPQLILHLIVKPNALMKLFSFSLTLPPLLPPPPPQLFSQTLEHLRFIFNLKSLFSHLKICQLSEL